jgi:hypothetical protein
MISVENESDEINTNSKSSNKTCDPKKNVHLYEVNIFSKAKFAFF